MPDHEGAQEFWDHRHDSAFRWLEQLRTDPNALSTNRAIRRTTSTYINVCLPASQVQRYRERAAAELAPYRLVVKDAGLWGVPELLSVRFEHQEPDAPEAPFELDTGTDLGLRLAHELGGSMEYCHGVGLRLAHLMDSEWGAGLETLRRVKRALDPQGLLNPGKLGL
jgi:FAD/FMN-containing dehydrogenase